MRERYFTRLPASLREPLTCVCGSSDVKHTGAYHRHHQEHSFTKEHCDAWHSRYYAMEYGGKSLIMRTFSTYRERFGQVGYSYIELKRTILGGNKQAFRIIIPKFVTLNTDPWFVYKYILSPMMKLGMNDWLQEYLQRYPDTAKTMHIDTRRELVIRALRSLDPVTIELMFRAGFELSANNYYNARSAYAHWAKSMHNDPSIDYLDHFDMTVKPILQKLRGSVFPCTHMRGMWYEYEALSPAHPSLD